MSFDWRRVVFVSVGLLLQACFVTTAREYSTGTTVSVEGKHSRREKPAQITDLADGALEAKGYAQIGSIAITDDREISPDAISGLREKAARNGADLVRIVRWSSQGKITRTMIVLADTYSTARGTMYESERTTTTRSVALSNVRADLFRHEPALVARMQADRAKKAEIQREAELARQKVEAAGAKLEAALPDPARLAAFLASEEARLLDAPARSFLLMANLATAKRESVVLLVKAGADPNYNGSMLLAAAEARNAEAFAALLDSGATLSAKDLAPLLRTAAAAGAIPVLEVVRKRGTDLLAPPGLTAAIDVAVRNGRNGTVHYLVDLHPAGARRSAAQAGALESAANAGGFSLVEELLRRGADPKARPVLQAAARRKDAQMARRLLDAGADPNAASPIGRTPLMEAAANRDGELAKMLLAVKAGVNAKDKDGRTALICAAISGSVEITNLLLSAGADVNAVAPKTSTGAGVDKGGTALDFAERHANNSVAEILVVKGGKSAFLSGTAVSRKLRHAATYEHSVLVVPARAGDVEAVKKALDSGVPVDILVPGSNATALTEAADEGRLEVVRLLIDRGADVNHRTITATALSRAAGSHPEVVKLLLERGADPNVRADTSLWVAPIINEAGGPHGTAENVAAMLRRKADPNATDWLGESPLLEAIHEDREDVARILLDAGADPNLATIHGEVPLLAARKKGNAAIERLLRARGANENASLVSAQRAVAIDTATPPLVAAAWGGNLDLVRALLDAGADPNVVKKEGGATPLIAAIEKGGPAVVKLLLERGASPDLATSYADPRKLAQSRGDAEVIRMLDAVPRR